MVKNSDIIGIFNLRSENSQAVHSYLKNSGSLYTIIDATNGEERSSLILTSDRLFISTISSITLKKRLEEAFLASSYSIID